jgi:YD repeat-containing protein
LLSDTVGTIVNNYTYSAFGELSSITSRHGTNTLFATTYTRDSLGRISTLQETIQGDTRTFRYTYDVAGRLATVRRNDTLISVYSYDPNGNRIAHATPTAVDSGRYDAQDRLIEYAGIQYEHTPAGYLKYKIHNGLPRNAVLRGDTTSFSYDAYGNLVHVRLPRQTDGGQADGTWVEYLIDATNRRIGKRVNGVTVQKFLYSGDLRIVAELDSADQVVARYVYAGRENVPYRHTTR